VIETGPYLRIVDEDIDAAKPGARGPKSLIATGLAAQIAHTPDYSKLRIGERFGGQFRSNCTITAPCLACDKSIEFVVRRLYAPRVNLWYFAKENQNAARSKFDFIRFRFFGRQLCVAFTVERIS
jgi:hypothetical protein